jgi:hypothetical protein
MPSGEKVSFVSYRFVDNTDVIQTGELNDTAAVLQTKMQQAIDTWEGGLKATEDAIIPEKTFCYFIIFECANGTWNYKLILESPGDLYTNDLWGVCKPI